MSVTVSDIYIHLLHEKSVARGGYRVLLSGRVSMGLLVYADGIAFPLESSESDVIDGVKTGCDDRRWWWDTGQRRGLLKVMFVVRF